MWQWWTLRKLRSEDFDTRSEAFKACVAARDVEVLGIVAQDANEYVRWAAVDALVEVADRRSVGVLIERLKDGHLNIREAAVRGLTRIGDPRAVPELLDLFEKEQVAQVRRAAMDALVAFGDARTVGRVLDMMTSRDDGTRSIAVELAGRLGDARAVPALIRMLSDVDPNTRWFTIDALGDLRDARAIEPLVAALATAEEGPLEAILKALAKIGDRGSIARVLPYLSDERRRVREAAAGALDLLNWTPPDAHHRALRAIALEDWPAVAALGADALEALVARLLDREEHHAKQVLTHVVRLKWVPRDAAERARYAVARFEFDLALAEGPAALPALVEAFRVHSLDRVEASARTLVHLIETHASRISKDDLEELAGMKDGWGVGQHTVFRDSYDDEGTSQAFTRDVSAAPVREKAKAELARRQGARK